MKLLKCPFCGDEGVIIPVRSEAPAWPFGAKAVCRSCHQAAIGVTQDAANEAAGESWNKRTDVNPADLLNLAQYNKAMSTLAATRQYVLRRGLKGKFKDQILAMIDEALKT